MAAGAAPMNFAAAAASAKEKDAPLRAVQIDGQVVLKIAKHCQESLPAVVTGQLLGLDVGQTLEVTDCFPFPGTDAAGDDAEDGSSYQLDMMRCLREVNADNNTVGWYQSTILSSYQTPELIDTFVNYHESIKRCICLIYDVEKAKSGSFGFKAIRLKDSFIKVYKEGGLTLEKLQASNTNWQDIFEEVPVVVHNSPIVAALVATIACQTRGSDVDFDKLNVNIAPVLEKNCELVNDSMGDLLEQQDRLSNYFRQFTRYQQQMSQFLQKRKQENMARKAAGEEPLPETDPNLRAPQEPPQLESYLVLNSLSTGCEMLNTFSSQGLEKLFLMEGLQQAK